MARSVLSSFVSGTRQVLAAQLFISIAAIGVAGWTLAVSNDLVRQRDEARERVFVLEASLAQHGVTPPPVLMRPPTPPPVRGQDAYPPSEPQPLEPLPQILEPSAPASSPTPGPIDAAPPQEAPPAAPAAQDTKPDISVRAPSIADVLGALFAAPPPARTLVLHARTRIDTLYARQIADELNAAGDISVSVDALPPGDQREAGYSYYDGRQSRAAAGLAQRFNDAARAREIAPWAASLRGTALPARAEFGAERVDIVLPPLPNRETAPALQRPALQRIDPRRLQVPPNTTPPPG